MKQSTSKEMQSFLNLDRLTLEDISEQSGRPINETVYLESLLLAKEQGCLFDVWKENQLQGYATLKELGEGNWFVLMFVTHPSCRNRNTFTSLFNQIVTHLKKVNATSLVSNVFKVNELSVAFHKKLGFEITREAPQGYEFTLALDSAAATNLLQWVNKTSTV